MATTGVFAAGLLICGAVSAQQPAVAGWELALEWMQTRVELLREHLDRAQMELRRRAKGHAELLARITPEIPKPRQHGYGLLPEILGDLALKRVGLHRNEFSIPLLTTKSAAVWRDGFQLAKQAKNGADLDGLVAEFERLRGQLTYLQGQVSYHRYWQKAVVDHARYFALRNRILILADRLQKLVDVGGAAAEIEKLRALIEAKVAPFQKTAGLKIHPSTDGTHVLAVTVVTDIEDDGFLQTFRHAVDDAYNRSAAAQAAKFRIDLTIHKLDAQKLHDGEAPARGAAVDEKAHLARFPEGALVLTTGAKSTHAFVGRYIQFGTKPMRPRELAHEFGHLLGFSDAYLRGFAGTPAGKLGCTVIEWGGLQDNLMGAPAHGRVTPGMIRRLRRVYGPAK
jgi:hypothetical protein